ncbi:MAG: nitrate reductase [Firmicutes bacterium]|nr:nitrate reductase [Bacillota bacterium]
MKRDLWRIIIYASIGTVALFLVVLYGLSGVTPETATKVSYAAAAEVGGECYDCHSEATPGITEQYAHSKHVTRGVSCLDCHTAEVDNAAVIEHKGEEMVAQPTPQNCAQCHQAEVAQFDASNHSARSWYAVAGAEDFTQEQLEKYQLVDENGNPKNNGKPNVVATYEGKESIELGCKKCHEIGKVREDGSVGNCSKCHIGHEFSVEQVRKPETCGQCHMGPDHPQIEIYEESPHGVMYHDSGESWNWDAAPGTLTAKDMEAPTCATCHMSAFGGAPGTHNVGERLKWNLTPKISSQREDWQSKRANMVSVCASCHNENFTSEHFEKADKLVGIADENVKEGQDLMAELESEGLITSEPFDHPIDFTMFELWHHEGRRARFGGMMGGPDYVQWHGIYDQKKHLTEMEEMAEELRNKSAEQNSQ